MAVASIPEKLGRAIALGWSAGPERGLAALDAIDTERLLAFPDYAAARAELERMRGDSTAARRHLVEGIGRARNAAERRFPE